MKMRRPHKTHYQLTHILTLHITLIQLTRLHYKISKKSSNPIETKPLTNTPTHTLPHTSVNKPESQKHELMQNAVIDT